MADESEGSGPSVDPGVVGGGGVGPATGSPKVPGWYPARTNPNEQLYWDGHDWTSRRRWARGTGWVEIAPDEEGSAPTTPTPSAGLAGADTASPQPMATANVTAAAPGVVAEEGRVARADEGEGSGPSVDTGAGRGRGAAPTTRSPTPPSGLAGPEPDAPQPMVTANLTAAAPGVVAEQGRVARADEGEGSGPSVDTGVGRGSGAAPAIGAPKEPGWYPVRTNPNEQLYWDGYDWTSRRRWAPGTGWAEVGPNSPSGAATTPTPPPGLRAPANPYAPRPMATASLTATAPGVTLGILLLVGSAVAMMVGSVGTWISTSSSISSTGGLPGLSATVAGVDQGVSQLLGFNGFITLIAATAVLVFGGLMAVSWDLSVRVVGLVSALASLGLAIYAVVRTIQKLNAAHPGHGVTVGIGWGLVLVLGAAFLASLISLYQVTQRG